MAISVNIPTTSKPRIVIIGGGFAGMELAKGLRSLEAQVVLLDKNNYHTFQPLLYQVATAALEADSIAYPFREIFKDQDNFIFRMTEVTKIRPQDHCIETSIGEISYEYLVIAAGSKTNYFGMKDISYYQLRLYFPTFYLIKNNPDVQVIIKISIKKLFSHNLFLLKRKR